MIIKRLIVILVVTISTLFAGVRIASADSAKPPGHPGNANKTAMCQYTAAINTWATVYIPTSQVGKKLAEGQYPDDTYNYGECLPA